ncbi:MAG: hypothetical protein JWQ09_5193 [Segetibacter sp.]|nr:hypothetical protein [Segetibacter sp.]
MKYYITNHTSKKNALNILTYHLYQDCKVLKSDYIRKEEFHKNSGATTLNYSDENELRLAYAQKGLDAKLCLSCEQRFAASVHDEHNSVILLLILKILLQTNA